MRVSSWLDWGLLSSLNPPCPATSILHPSLNLSVPLPHTPPLSHRKGTKMWGSSVHSQMRKKLETGGSYVFTWWGRGWAGQEISSPTEGMVEGRKELEGLAKLIFPTPPQGRTVPWLPVPVLPSGLLTWKPQHRVSRGWLVPPGSSWAINCVP